MEKAGASPYTWAWGSLFQAPRNQDPTNFLLIVRQGS